ncbi:MAG: PAS domain S-box protein [Nibricoccus sp.]
METSDYTPLPPGAKPESLDDFLRVWLRIVGGTIMVVAGAALCGWIFRLPALVSVVPGGAPMVVNSAGCFFLISAGLVSWSWDRPRWARWPWLAVLVIAAASLVESLGNISLGIDEIFWRQDLALPMSAPGRMSPNAAISFICIGLALQGVVTVARKRWLVLMPAGLTLCLALLSLLGYASGLRAAHSWGNFTGMAMPTAVLFLILAVTIIEVVARFHRGLGFNSPPALFTVALVLLVACGRMSHVMNAEVSTANQEVVTAYEFRETMHRYILALTRMQATDRAYALTGDEYYADRRAIYVKELRSALGALEWQAEKYSFRRDRIARLKPLTEQRIQESDAVMRAKRAGDIEEQIRLLQPSNRVVSALAAELEAEDDLFLKERENVMKRIERNAGLVLAAGVLVGALLLAAAFYLVHRARRALQLSHMALERRVNERTADLQRSEESLRFLADTMPQVVWTTRPDGVVETFNRGWHDYTGLNIEQSLENWTQAVWQEDLKAFHGEWIEALKIGREGRGEYRLRRASDGMFRWHLWRARPQRDRVGKLVRWVGTSTDIHDQKEAAHALELAVNERTAELATAKRQMEEINRLQRAVLDGTVFSVIAVDTSGVIQIFNTGSERMLGWKREEVVGRVTPQVIHDAAEIAARANELTRELGHEIEPGFEVVVARTRLGEADEREWTFIRKDGTRLPVQLSVTALRDQAGAITGFMGIANDLTRSRAAETALRDSEERFRQSFQFAGIGMALVGLDGRWLQVNPAVCQILGYNAQELFAKTFQDITHPDDLRNDLALLRQLVAGERSFYQMEKRYFHREGRVVWGRLTVTLVRRADGTPVHFISQIEDIAARKELEENLARARDEALAAARLKSEFLANMSHEIRTPMNGVLGMARLLMETKLGQEQRRMGQVVLSSAENLLTIIDDILDFSKIEAGKMRIDPHGFDLVKLVRETTELLSSQAKAKGVTLVCEVGAEKSCGLVGDSGRIRQVLTNMMGNALKFTEEGRVGVTLRLGEENDGQRRFSLTVIDTGIGISPEVQARLFQPFMQAEAGGRKYGGTGLGLAICRQLVELMGGRIGCESREGAGSRFWFELELPVWRPEDEEPGRPVKAARGPGGLHLLVAEDNPANQLVARLTLEKMGHQVELAANGREALEKLSASRFDAVLMDCQMPEMDGYEATRRLREGQAEGADVSTPVIALTAYALAGDRARCLAAGMNEYVTKPLSAEQLRQALARCGIDPGKARTTPPMGTTPPMVPASRPVLVEQQLARLALLKSPDGTPLTEHLFALLAAEMPGRIAAMTTALDARDAEVLGRVAHTLAGSCANLGAEALESVARELENEAKRGGWSDAPGCLTRIANEWERLRTELARRFPKSFP